MTPIREREALRQQRNKAQGVLSASHNRVVELDRCLERNDQERIEAYAAQARGEQADTDVIDRDRHKLLTEQRETVARRDGAGLVVQRIDAEISALQSRELDAFVREAERQTQDALEALEAVRGPYLAAQAAWATAQHEWLAIQTQLQESITESDREVGMVRDPSVVARDARAVAFPFKESPAIFDAGHAPRPRALTPDYAPTEPDDLSDSVDVVVTDALGLGA